MTALISRRNYYLHHQYLYYTSQHSNTLLVSSCFICDLKEQEGLGMGWVKAVLVLVVLQSVTTSLPHRAAAEDLLSPFFSTCSHVFKFSGLTDAFHFYSLISLPSVASIILVMVLSVPSTYESILFIHYRRFVREVVCRGRSDLRACKNRVAILISLKSLQKLAHIPIVERALVLACQPLGIAVSAERVSLITGL
ncbi:hypothetical protein BHM03_00051240 [Ensete ventricosum]|nr:hypothetical protein BHM03_00051240 [Ensete ventricosum]